MASTVVVAVDVGKNEFAFSVTDVTRRSLLKARTGCPMTGLSTRWRSGATARLSPGSAKCNVRPHRHCARHRPLLLSGPRQLLALAAAGGGRLLLIVVIAVSAPAARAAPTCRPTPRPASSSPWRGQGADDKGDVDGCSDGPSSDNCPDVTASALEAASPSRTGKSVHCPEGAAPHGPHLERFEGSRHHRRPLSDTALPAPRCPHRRSLPASVNHHTCILLADAKPTVGDLSQPPAREDGRIQGISNR